MKGSAAPPSSQLREAAPDSVGWAPSVNVRRLNAVRRREEIGFGMVIKFFDCFGGWESAGFLVANRRSPRVGSVFGGESACLPGGSQASRMAWPRHGGAVSPSRRRCRGWGAAKSMAGEVACVEKGPKRVFLE